MLARGVDVLSEWKGLVFVWVRMVISFVMYWFYAWHGHIYCSRGSFVKVFLRPML